MSKQIEVYIIYALPNEQEVITLSVAPNTSVGTAIIASKILDKYPAIDLTKNKLGIYGKLCKLDTIVEEFDRIEIYRPLVAEPREIRKKLAAATAK